MRKFARCLRIIIKNFIFYGSSQTFGYNVKDNQTIAANFKNILDKNYKDYCVYNNNNYIDASFYEIDFDLNHHFVNQLPIFILYENENEDKLKHINYKFDYTHVATDVGSQYWQEYINNPREVDSFIRELKRLDKTSKETGIHFGNLCFYFPKELEIEDVLKFEMVIYFDECLTRDKTSYHYVLNNYNHSEYLNLLICIYEKYFRGLKVNEVLHGNLKDKFIKESLDLVRNEFQSKQQLYKG